MIRKLYRFKPLFKKFITVRSNTQNKKKLLKFKREKWSFLKNKYEKKFRFFKKYKALDQDRYLVSKFAKKGNSYKKRYRNTFQAIKKFKLYYVELRKRRLKKIIKTVLKQQKKRKSLNRQLIKYFESRLDVILVRAQFCVSIRLAQQIIKHGKIYVNGKIIKQKAHSLKPGSLIEVNDNFKWQLDRTLRAKAPEENTWPYPPKYLHINYRTLQIIFGAINHTNFSVQFFTTLDLKKILLNSKNY